MVGIVIGAIAGAQLGRGLTRLYGDFFHFPFLIFMQDPRIYLLAAAVCAAAAIAGALRSVFDVLKLAPAVAMQPPAPPRYRRLLKAQPRLMPQLSQITTMAVRHILHWPLRATFTLIGIALACGLMVTALLSFDSIELMIDVAFNRMERQQATIDFVEAQHPRATLAVAAMPGVLRAEPYRSAPVRLINGARSRQLAITGLTDNRDLSRVLDAEFKPVELPATGLAVGERVAEILDLRRGDMVTVEATSGKRRTTEVPITDIIKSYFGLSVYMRIAALDELLDDGDRVSGVHVAYEDRKSTRLNSSHIQKSRMPSSA